MPCQGPSAEEERTHNKQVKFFKMAVDLQEIAHTKEMRKPFISMLYSEISLALDKAMEWRSTGGVFDDVSKGLCEYATSLTSEEQDLIMYDGRHKACREFANWWESHQEDDRRRETREKESRAQQKAKEAYNVRRFIERLWRNRKKYMMQLISRRWILSNVE